MASVLKCGDITAAILLSLQVQLIRLFALTFRQPCLRRTRWPKCHHEIYSCERWVLEWREGVCSQVGKEQMNLTVQWFSIFSLSFFFSLWKFHLVVFPFLFPVSTVKISPLSAKLCFILVQCSRCFNNIYTS